MQRLSKESRCLSCLSYSVVKEPTLGRKGGHSAGPSRPCQAACLRAAREPIPVDPEPRELVLPAGLVTTGKSVVPGTVITLSPHDLFQQPFLLKDRCCVDPIQPDRPTPYSALTMHKLLCTFELSRFSNPPLAQGPSITTPPQPLCLRFWSTTSRAQSSPPPPLLLPPNKAEARTAPTQRTSPPAPETREMPRSPETPPTSILPSPPATRASPAGSRRPTPDLPTAP